MGLSHTSIIQPVTPSEPHTYYCDPGDIRRRIGVEGIKLFTQDFGDNAAAGEIGVMDEAIWIASDVVDQYVFKKYDPADLRTSYMIKDIATNIAVYELYTRRGNSPTGSVMERYEKSVKKLEEVARGLLEIPNIPVRYTEAPGFTNYRIDQRFSTHRVRVETNLSDRSAVTYPRSKDYYTEFDPIL